LWKPDPTNFYQQVSIGDVGYIREGYFVRIFNILLPHDDPSNRLLGEPEPYPCLDFGPFINIRRTKFSAGDYYSRCVDSTQESTAAAPDKYVIPLSQMNVAVISTHHLPIKFRHDHV
jgi:hypothetical protein